jgi:hypothetical protein
VEGRESQLITTLVGQHARNTEFGSHVHFTAKVSGAGEEIPSKEALPISIST